MILNDINYQPGLLSIGKKIRIATDIISNPFNLILDKLGVKKEIFYKTKNGVNFFARSRSTDINEAVVVLSGKEYPPELVKISTKNKSVIIDAGSNIGMFTLYMKHLYPSSKCYAVEPFEQNISMLKKNLLLNGINDVTIIQAALYNKNGHVDFNVDGNRYDGGKIINHKLKNDKKIKVRSIDFTNLVNIHNLKRVDLLKMDIEGSEYSVIENDMATISEVVKKIIIEYHTNYKKDGRDFLLRKIMQDNAFELIYESKNILGFINNRL